MKTRTNGNYEIIKSARVGSDLEIVMGYCELSNFYVCWYCYNGDDYRGGYYLEDYDKVFDEYLRRLS